MTIYLGIQSVDASPTPAFDERGLASLLLTLLTTWTYDHWVILCFLDEHKGCAAVLTHNYRLKISDYILLTIIYSQQDIVGYTPQLIRLLRDRMEHRAGRRHHRSPGCGAQ